MNPTHDHDRSAPEPGTALVGSPQFELAGLLTDDDRFGAWIAQAVATAAQPPTVPAATGRDGFVVTAAGRQALADAGGDAGDAPGTAAHVLRSAALYLERHGWIQGAYYDATAGVFTPPACLVGAIGMVCYGGPVDAPAQHFDHPGFLDFEEAVLHLDQWLLAEDGTESYEFNDARGRTVDDVIHVLRMAAATSSDEILGALWAIETQNERIAELFGGDVE